MEQNPQRLSHLIHLARHGPKDVLRLLLANLSYYDAQDACAASKELRAFCQENRILERIAARGKLYVSRGGAEQFAQINVTGGKGVAYVGCGAAHVILVTTDGQVYGFGDGRHGALGDGNYDAHTIATPMRIHFPHGPVVQVSCGYTFSIFMTRSGHLYSCGDAMQGFLGLTVPDFDAEYDWEEMNAFRSIIFKPVEFDFDADPAVQISTHGYYTWILTRSKQLYTFGGAFKIMGNFMYDEIPTRRLENKNIIQISLGYKVGLVLTDDGVLWAFGHYIGLVKLYTDQISDPVVQIHAGHAHYGFVTQNGNAYVAGKGAGGKLGDGHTKRHRVKVPFRIPLAADAIGSITCGDFHTALVTRNTKRLYIVGSNAPNDTYATGFNEPKLVPTLVSAITDPVTSVFSNANQTFAISNNPLDVVHMACQLCSAPAKLQYKLFPDVRYCSHKCADKHWFGKAK